uniref:BPTI/Kunitz inhibitor domain-containing protein n=1 Tax=Panagrolaimus sp. PS1159 TaxID=55785 RepID=A0AC35FTJ1_9BILA
MILRVIIFVTIVVGCFTKEDDNFMSANVTNQQLSDGTHPGLLPSSSVSQYPSQPNTYNSYPQFTVGVSSSGSPCSLPQQIGTGPYRIPRWYFNPARMRCELFYWSGCCGNGNNFNTFQSCQQICEGGNLGTPQNSPGAQQFLNVQQSSQIPSEWLLGRNANNNNNNNNIQVSVSVKQFPQECCQQPFSPGIGEYAIPRWYYEGRSGNCQIYLYRGFGGAGNNFRSQEECQKICKEIHANANANMANGPAPHIVIPDNSDTNVLIGFGQQQQRTINIPNIAAYTTTFSPIQQYIVRTTSPQTPSIEIVIPQFPTAAPRSIAPAPPQPPLPPPQPQPPQYRPETAAPLPPPPAPITTTRRPLLLPTTTQPPPLQPRATTASTINSISEVDPCTQERDQGVGALQLPRYFFNKETKLCEQFIFFGSASNRNNFNTLEECQNQCPESPNPCAYGTTTTLMSCAPGSVLSQTCSGQQFCHVGATPQTTVCCNKPATNIDRCSQPLNVGVGNSNLQRWYFNPLTQQCQPCFYKGLQGNENNFLSRQDCENSCAKKSGPQILKPGFDVVRA